MMRAIVLVLCLAAAGAIAAYTQFSEGDSGEPVYTVRARAPDPASKPGAPTAARPIDPDDRGALARALQRELKRVGCYSGEVTGVWTTSSRMAMKTFIERVNATLPIDYPDPVLLSLVQGHHDRACGVACPAGQTAGDGGACLPNAILARPAKASSDARFDLDTAVQVVPEAAGSSAAAMALTAPAAGAMPEPKAPAPAASRSAAATVPSPGGPVPPEGMVREHRPRRSAEAPSAPPKVVRDFLKVLGF
jgi:peptidoglycan hydrolase-like protein with peptidoglycan-binding domain